MTLIKSDIVGYVTQSIGTSRNESAQMVEALLKLIKAELGSGNDINISGFGKFFVKHKNSRIGRNPKTKVAYEITERTVVTFAASKVFRREMNPE